MGDTYMEINITLSQANEEIVRRLLMDDYGDSYVASIIITKPEDIVKLDNLVRLVRAMSNNIEAKGRVYLNVCGRNVLYREVTKSDDIKKAVERIYTIIKALEKFFSAYTIKGEKEKD